MSKRKRQPTPMSLSCLETMSAPTSLACFLEVYELFMVCQVSKKMLDVHSLFFMKRTNWNLDNLPKVKAFRNHLCCLLTPWKRISSRKLDINKITTLTVICKCHNIFCFCGATIPQVNEVFPKVISLTMRSTLLQPVRQNSYNTLQTLHVVINTFENFQIPTNLQHLNVVVLHSALVDDTLMLPHLPSSLRYLNIENGQKDTLQKLYLTKDALPEELLECSFDRSFVIVYEHEFKFPLSLIELNVGNFPREPELPPKLTGPLCSIVVPKAVLRLEDNGDHTKTSEYAKLKPHLKQLISFTHLSRAFPLDLNDFDACKLTSLTINQPLPHSSIVLPHVEKFICASFLSATELKECSKSLPNVCQLEISLEEPIGNLLSSAYFSRVAELTLRCVKCTVDLTGLLQLVSLLVKGVGCNIMLPAQLHTLSLCAARNGPIYMPFPSNSPCMPNFVSMDSLQNIVVLEVETMQDVPFDILPMSLQVLKIGDRPQNWRTTLAKKRWSHLVCLS
jgi:hypothetical protein